METNPFDQVVNIFGVLLFAMFAIAAIGGVVLALLIATGVVPSHR